jgi:hypothetical protein
MFIMKRISLVAMCFVLGLSAVYAQQEKISFNETIHDFATIGESDGNVSCEFIVTNKSDAPLLIANVKASCGCTTPKWTKEPIEPGKKGSITATYNPSGRVAPFSKTITVYTNLGTPVELRIKGEVVKGSIKPHPENDYPEAWGNYLLKSKELVFNRIASNETKTIRLEVFNKSTKPITQKVSKLPKYLSVVFTPQTIPGESKATIDITLDAEAAKQLGKLNGDISLEINGVSYSLPYSATILDNFENWSPDKKANAGKININFSELNFGNFSAGDSRTIKISNSGKTKLNIKNVQPANSAISVSKTKFSVNPGEIVELKVNVDKSKVASPLSSSISIFTDDPKTPVFEIVVTAKP